MTTTIKLHEASVSNAGAGQTATSAVNGADVEAQASRLTSEQVWRSLARASFAVISHVTPAAAPRSSGVVYAVAGRRLYVAVAPDSWKARNIAITGQVAVTVPVRRGGVLSLVLPIPPATVSFHATAIVHPPGSLDIHTLSRELEALLPAGRRASAAVIEIVPEGYFLTYGLGVSLMQMANPPAARARVPVTYKSGNWRT
jgi:hypothetical protein